MKDSTENMWFGVKFEFPCQRKRRDPVIPFQSKKRLFLLAPLLFLLVISLDYSHLCGFFSPRNMGYTRSYYISSLASMVLLRELMLSVTLDLGCEFTETLPFLYVLQFLEFEKSHGNQSDAIW